MNHRQLTRKPGQAVVVYDPESHVFYHDKRILTGVTNLISKMFFHPNFHMLSLNGQTATKTATNRYNLTSSAKLGNESFPSSKSGRPGAVGIPTTGSNMGRRVDRELAIWAENNSSPFKQKTIGVDFTLESADKNWHPYTRELVKYFTEVRRWRPVAAQVTVGDPRGVATNIDLVMEDSNGEIILVEVKAGYNQTFKGNWPTSTKETKPSKWLTGNLHDLRADALNFALIEIHWGMRMWYFCFANPPSAAFVAHVSDEGVRLYDTEPWILPAMDRIEDYMALRGAALRDRRHNKQVQEWETEQRKIARSQARKRKLELMAQRRETRKQKAASRANPNEDTGSEEVKLPSKRKQTTPNSFGNEFETLAKQKKKTRKTTKKKLTAVTSSSEEFRMTAKRSDKRKTPDGPFRSSSIMPLAPKITFKLADITTMKKIRLEED